MNNDCLTFSKDNLINRKMSDQTNIEVNSVELKAKYFSDFTSFKTEFAKACNIIESFNGRTQNDNNVNKDLNITGESENNTALNLFSVSFGKGDSKNEKFKKIDKKVEKLTKAKDLSIHSSMKRELDIEKDSINKYNQTANQFINISFNHHIECLFQADVDFECSRSLGKTADYKPLRLNKPNSTKTIFSKFIKLKKIRSNQVSPVGLKPEVKSKSKFRKFASNVINGLRKSFGNLRQACRSLKNPLVFCSVPFYFNR